LDITRGDQFFATIEQFRCYVNRKKDKGENDEGENGIREKDKRRMAAREKDKREKQGRQKRERVDKRERTEVHGRSIRKPTGRAK